MNNLKSGDRVLCERNGVQFAGTIKKADFVEEEAVITHYQYAQYVVVADVDGRQISTSYIKEKLTGIRAAKVGDVLQNGDKTATILEIGSNHNAILVITDIFDSNRTKNLWWAFDHLDLLGWKLKTDTKEPMTFGQWCISSYSGLIDIGTPLNDTSNHEFQRLYDQYQAYLSEQDDG